MENDVKKFLSNIIYISYKNSSFNAFVKNTYATLYQFMPISKICLYKFDTKIISKISQYTHYEKMFKNPDEVKIDEELFKRLVLEEQGNGDVLKPKIYKNNHSSASGKVFHMLHIHDGTSLYFPLMLESDPYTVIFLSIFSSMRDCYTEEHIKLCEYIYEPFSMIIKEIISAESKKEDCFEIDKYNIDQDVDSNKNFLDEKHTAFIPLDEYISEYIRRAIHHTNGRISGKHGAADLLGLRPTTLWSKMRKLGIKTSKRLI